MTFTIRMRHAAGAILCAAAAAILCAAAAARADDYVAIRCDAAAGVVRIEKHLDVEAATVPRAPGVRRLDDMVGSRPRADDDLWMFPVHDLVRTCRVGRVRYVVRARLRLWGSHSMGRCGEAPPSIDATVTRDGAVLLKDFTMGDACGDTGTDDVDIQSLALSEATRRLSVQATMRFDAAAPPFALDFGFDALPALTLQKAYAARPAASAASAP